MALDQIHPEQVVAASVEALGFDNSISNLSTPEVLAGAIRRAASFLAPITPRALAAAVRESARGLVDDVADDDLFPVRAMIDSVIAYGDLVEVPVDDDGVGPARRTLFLAQPSFVRAGSALCILIGIRADGVPLLDDTLADLIDHDTHVRRIRFSPDDDPTAALEAIGLHETSQGHWLEHPAECDATSLVAEYDLRLASSGPSGTIEGCQILDTSRPVTYYRGRWRPPTKHDLGNFIARRRLQYGADAWCYAKFVAGEVTHLIDLPVHAQLGRSCDEAWRLQAATDLLIGAPQVVRVGRAAQAGKRIVNLMSPIPSWAQRRLDTTGRPLPRQRGSLISYIVDEDQLEDELGFLRKMMWIEPDEGERTQ